MNTAPAAPCPNRRHWLLLTAGLCVLFAGFLGTRGLNEPDEGRYANIALAMARPGGDWWEPRMSGYGHYDKPPLIYWATAASFRAFGQHEWSARLPSLFGALMALIGLGWTAYRLRGAAVAWWAVLIAGTSLQFWAFGRILSPDMLLTGWCTLAVAAWAEARRWELLAQANDTEENFVSVRSARYRSWLWWGASLLAWTSAWWTKATPALIPLAGLMFGVLLTGDRAGRRALRPSLLFPAILVLGSPWYLSMLHTYPELKGFFFGRELAGRLTGRVDGRHGSFFYYVPVSLGAWLPWWPLAAWAVWRKRGQSTPVLSESTGQPTWRQRIGVEGWMVATGLLILSLTASKLPSYTLILVPWAALLMSRTLLPAATATLPNWRQLLLWPAVGFGALALVGSATLPQRFESHLGPNSSVREVCAFLRDQGAAQVDADRYLPGLEFYLHENKVRYLIRIDDAPGSPTASADRESSSSRTANKIERYHERTSDPGVPPDRFIDPGDWLRPADPLTRSVSSDGWWLVRLHTKGKSLFERRMNRLAPIVRPLKVKRIGDFDLYRVPGMPLAPVSSSVQ